MGTISAFVYRHRETKKNLCRGGKPVSRWRCLLWDYFEAHKYTVLGAQAGGIYLCFKGLMKDLIGIELPSYVEAHFSYTEIWQRIDHGEGYDLYKALYVHSLHVAVPMNITKNIITCSL